MATDLATHTPSKSLVVMLDNRREDFQQLLGPAIPVDGFLRVVKNAIIRDPQIAEADQQSVFLECQKAAQDGLVLDGREAVLTRYNTKVKNADGSWGNKVVVAYIPMILGIKKRVRNSGLITSWNFGIVYLNEAKAGRFKYWRDDTGQHLLHDPFLPAVDGDPGPVVAAYSAARLSDGSVEYDVMSVEELNAIRNRTKSRKYSQDKNQPGEITGPWATDLNEMYKKTVARRHAKSLPMSSEDRAVIERVDNQYDFTKSADDEIYSMPAEPPPASVANKRNTSAATKLKKETQPAQEEPEPVENAVDVEVNDADPF